ncbi:hypothetical protein [Gemmatimonas sp. UBA7669]|uniref:hypothetical protein n=1 Tax=Gemmatimonas sp. UBA7669 TaxID=1946568 RepID=UPI0025C6BB58|nr:hypothetical protein [Gemmatimonas sp. UBA7669]
MPKNQLETAQLQREIVGVAVHDLGSVAAALAMRAALPPAVAVAHVENQQSALVSLAAQVRSVMQLLEMAQLLPDLERDAAASLAPALAPGVAFPTWLEPWPTLGRRVLPRGSRLAVDAAPDPKTQELILSAHAAAVGMHVLLAALHDVRSAGPVNLRVTLTSDGQLSCQLDTRSRIRRVGQGRESRWQRHGERLAGTMSWSLRWWEDIADEHGSQSRLTLQFAP